MHRVVNQWENCWRLATAVKAIIRNRLSQSARRCQLEKWAQNLAPGDTAIIFYPDYRKLDPHQQRLADALPHASHCQAGTIADALFLQSRVRPGVKLIFHLHWAEPILQGPLFSRFITGLNRFRQRGGTTLWSIHNLLPRTLGEDAARIKLPMIAKHMHHVHLHTPADRQTIKDMYDIADEQWLVAPYGNHIKTYPNNVGKAEARNKLALAPDTLVYCFFGQMRPYKGLEQLLDAMARVTRVCPNATLMLTGKLRMRDAMAMRPLLRRAKNLPWVRAYTNYIAADDVQYYLNAADVVVLPYRSVMNSGTFIVALSFGCCIVAPATGAIAELAKSGVHAILYDLRDEHGLENALRMAAELSPDQRKAMGANAFKLAQSLCWEELAETLYRAAA